MNRDEKVSKVSELNETFSKAKFAVVTDYRGLKVTELEELRRELKKSDAQIRVAKNSLLKLAVKDTDYEILSEYFTGTTAVAVSFEDPVASAKALSGFAKDYEALSIRSAALDGSVLNEIRRIEIGFTGCKRNDFFSLGFHGLGFSCYSKAQGRFDLRYTGGKLVHWS